MVLGGKMKWYVRQTGEETCALNKPGPTTGVLPLNKELVKKKKKIWEDN